MAFLRFWYAKISDRNIDAPLASDKRSDWRNERRGKAQPLDANGINWDGRILSVRDDLRGLCDRVREEVTSAGTRRRFFYQAVWKQAMASEMFLSFGRPLNPAQRLGIALLASALLHALMVMALSTYSIHGNVFNRLVRAPLSVRIERLPETPKATPIANSDKNALLHQKLNVPKPVAASPPDKIAQSLSRNGVSVSETLYLRPIPNRVSGPLLATGEFRRASDISEKPEAVAMKVPGYPRPAREEKVSGWVIVMLRVDERGYVVDTAAVESSEPFNDYEKEVAEDLRGSIFNPGKLDGQAVKTLMFVTVRFDSKGVSGFGPAEKTNAPGSAENRARR